MERYGQVLEKIDVTGNFEISCLREKGCLRKEVCFGFKNRGKGPQLTILDK
jgi:hypothetical protein